MEQNIEINKNLQEWHLMEYNRILTAFSENRKKAVTIAELCRRLKTQRNAIYRIEKGLVDPRLSSIVDYLHGFGYHLEIVPDSPEKVSTDFVVEGTNLIIESDSKKKKTDSKLNKKQSVEMLRMILEFYEEDLESEKKKYHERLH